MPVTLGIGTAALGAIQSGVGFFEGKKYRKQLQNLQTPTYTPARSISDYYNQALSRYQQSPQQSNLYKMQAQNIARGTAQGIAGLQDRRSGLAGISGLIQGQSDAQLKALAASEQDQNQKFSQLGSASQAMAGEERQAFNINKMLPYQKQYDILSQKAGGSAQLMNAGLQNISGGMQTALMGNYMMGNKSPSSSMSGNNESYDSGRYLPPSTYKVPLASY